MLTIFETIENSLIIPKNLDDFEDLIRKELQKPILLTSPSLDEQVPNNQFFFSLILNLNLIINLEMFINLC